MASDTKTPALPSEHVPEPARQVLIDRASDAPRLRDELDRLARRSRTFAFASLGFGLGATVMRLLPTALGAGLGPYQDGLLMGITLFGCPMAITWLLLEWLATQAEDGPNRRTIIIQPTTPPATKGKNAQAPGPTKQDLERLLDRRTDQVLGAHRALHGLRSVVRAGLAVGALTASLFGPAALALWGSATLPGQRPLLVIVAALLLGWNAGCLVTLHRLRRLAHETLA